MSFNTPISAATRVPRNKPIDYSVMREAPFYDGLIRDAHKTMLRNDKDIWQCITTAHWARGLYVISSDGTYMYPNVVMGTEEGFPVMRIQMRHGDGNKRIIKLSTPHGYESVIDGHMDLYAQSENVSRIINIISRGKRDGGRRVGGYRDDLHQASRLVPENVPSYVIGSTSDERITAKTLFDAMCETRLRNFLGRTGEMLSTNLGLKPINAALNAAQINYAVQCLGGALKITDIPPDILTSIAQENEKYQALLSRDNDTIEMLRELLCRPKLVVAKNAEMSRAYDEDSSMLVGVIDMTCVFNLIMEYRRTGRAGCFHNYQSPHFANTAMQPLRRYASLAALPADLSARIVQRIIPLRIRTKSDSFFPKPVDSSETAKMIFPEINTFIRATYTSAMVWYVTDY